MWQYDNPSSHPRPTAYGAVPVWAPKLNNNGLFLTVPGSGFKGAKEVKMTYSSDHWDWTDGTQLLYTRYASGGCSPFAFVIHAEGGRGVNTIGLAHLCFNRDKEAREMGAFARTRTTHAAFVYLVLVHYTGSGGSPELSAFENFSQGFGQPIPTTNLGVVTGTSATAVVHPAGYVGEMPPAGSKKGEQPRINVVPPTNGAPQRWVSATPSPNARNRGR